MGNRALAIGPKLPRPSSTLPRQKVLAVQQLRRFLGVQQTRRTPRRHTRAWPQAALAYYFFSPAVTGTIPLFMIVEAAFTDERCKPSKAGPSKPSISMVSIHAAHDHASLS